MIDPVDLLSKRGGEVRKRGIVAGENIRPNKRRSTLSQVSKDSTLAPLVDSRLSSQNCALDAGMGSEISKAPAPAKAHRRGSSFGWHRRTGSGSESAPSRLDPFLRKAQDIVRIRPTMGRHSAEQSGPAADPPARRGRRPSIFNLASASESSNASGRTPDLLPPSAPERTSSREQRFFTIPERQRSESRSRELTLRRRPSQRQQESLSRQASSHFAASSRSQLHSLCGSSSHLEETGMDSKSTQSGYDSDAESRHVPRHWGPMLAVVTDSDSDWKMNQAGYVDSDGESAVCMTPEPEAFPRHQPLSTVTQIQRIDPATRLPAELLIHVCSYLDAQALSAVTLASRKWASVATDPAVESSVFLRRWSPKPLSSPLPKPVGGRGIGKSKISKSQWTQQDWPTMYRARAEIEHNWTVGRAKKEFMFGHTDSVYCVQFDEHKAITGSRDRTVRVWDLKTSECIKVIGGPHAFRSDEQARAREPDLTPDMRLQINAQGLPKLDRSIYHVPKYYHPASILCLQYDDEIMVTGSSDASLIVWDIKTFEPIRQLKKHSSGVLDLAFDSDKIISCSKDFTICIWDRATGELLDQIAGHQGPVNAVQLRGNLLISASGEGTSRLYNLNFSRTKSAFNGQPDSVTVNPQFIREFRSKDRGLACVEFSDDTQTVLAGGNDHLIFKYSTSPSSNPSSLPVVPIGFMPFGHHQPPLAQTAQPFHDSSTFRVPTARALLDPSRVPFLRSHRGLNLLNANPASHHAGDHTSTHPPDSLPSQSIAGHTNLVRSLYLDGANSRIVSGSYDMSLKIWDFTTGDLQQTFPNLTTSWMLSAKADYRRIVATSQDGRVVILDFGGGVKGVDTLAG